MKRYLPEAIGKVFRIFKDCAPYASSFACRGPFWLCPENAVLGGPEKSFFGVSRIQPFFPRIKGLGFGVAKGRASAVSVAMLP